MNQILENYLRCFCRLRQDDWDTYLPAAKFAYNSARSEELQATPFELDIGWNLSSPLYLGTSFVSSVVSVTDFKDRFNSTLKDAQFTHVLAKACNAAYVARNFKEPTYKKHDKVWLSRSIFSDANSKAEQSDKLGTRRFRTFEILNLIWKNAVRLTFLRNMRLHTVVHVSHSRPVIDQTENIAYSVYVAPIPMPDNTGSPLFEVKQILGHRNRGHGFQWLTHLTRTPQHEDTWQTTRDFVDPDGTLT